jgi:hypothetical protein
VLAAAPSRPAAALAFGAFAALTAGDNDEIHSAETRITHVLSTLRLPIFTPHPSAENQQMEKGSSHEAQREDEIALLICWNKEDNSLGST